MEGQGPVNWAVPPGGHFIKIDRHTGQRLPDYAEGANVQAEYIRDGQELMVGGYGQTVDAGWKMGADVPLFDSVRQLAGDRAGAGARPDPVAAVEPLARLDVERRALLSPWRGTPPGAKVFCIGFHKTGTTTMTATRWRCWATA